MRFNMDPGTLVALALACACAAQAEQWTVRSRDGVPISVQKSGSGPALLLVHGSGSDGGFTWYAVLPALSKQFTVYAMDRRGRGASGDGKNYSLAAEAADIAAVTGRIGQPITLLAHSYGALCALAALDQLKNVTNLILYEPPLLANPPGPEWANALAQMERALAANDREQVVTLFLRDAVGVPPQAIDGIRGSPAWKKQVETAATLPRETRAVSAYRLPAAQLARWKVPTTMLLGSQSQGYIKEATPLVCNAIPGCRIVTLENQGHLAMASAPDLFVAKVEEAVRKPAR
jgi:pimeloyl-ACP methyl ester carboxylesterase